MPARTPGFVSLNDRQVKVQQWKQHDDRVLLTTLVHGDAAGIDLLDHLRASSLLLVWDGNPPVPVRPEIANHRVAGSGPTTVHRIEVTLWFMKSGNEPRSAEPMLSTGDKLDRILHELQLLRAEVAELRAQRRPAAASATPLAAGQTLLDFDIDIDEGS